MYGFARGIQCISHICKLKTREYGIWLSIFRIAQ